MKKILLCISCIACLILCACSSEVVFNGCEIKVEPCAWSYEHGKEKMNAIAGEIGEESEAWNELYFPYIIFSQNQDEPQYMLFTNSRAAVIYNYSQSSGKIIDVTDFYPQEFNTTEDKMMFYKFNPQFDISKDGRYTLMSSSLARQPIYVFDNEKGTAKKITLSQPKRAFFIENSLYICFAEKGTYIADAKEYTTSVLYDPQSGKIEKTEYTEQNEPEPPVLDEYTNIGGISLHIDSFIWDGTISKDVITESNNTDPYKVTLYLYNSSDKTYCSEVINICDLVQ
jgi:hypothetical protein